MTMLGDLGVPLVRGVYEWLAEDNNDDDVITLKNFLRPLGFGRSSPATCFADQEFLDDIRRYQKDRGLKVDGVVALGGETSRSIARDLDEKINLFSKEDELLEWQDVGDEWGESELQKRCVFNMLKFDKLTCKQLEKTRRRQGRYKHLPEGQAAAAYWASLNDRLAHCLAGKPLDEQPPLNIWD